jgi:hypothetical protein
VIAVQNVQETNLAWALIEVVKPRLEVLERNYAFVTIGAGDTFAAIHHLLKMIAAKGIPLPPSLVRLCVTWLDSYAFHDQEPYLRGLIEGFLLPDTIRALSAACVNPLSTARKRTEPLWVNQVSGRAVSTSAVEIRLLNTFRARSSKIGLSRAKRGHLVSTPTGERPVSEIAN